MCAHCGHHNVSVPDDRLEALVSQASKPTLASLFRRAKDKGVLTPGKDYGESK